jgi:uncharacterized membrane protein
VLDGHETWWKVQRKQAKSKVEGALVPRRAKYGSHCRAKGCTEQQGQLRVSTEKMFCRSRFDTHKIKKMNRVKV